jgi:hypothetical protein
MIHHEDTKKETPVHPQITQIPQMGCSIPGLPVDNPGTTVSGRSLEHLRLRGNLVQPPRQHVDT